MRVPVPCVVCSKGRKAGNLVFARGELDESGVIYAECDASHRTAVIYDARRHEVLLRSGGKALLSGFANEAIASLAAALERAYEFYIRVICRKHSIDEKEMSSAWKEVGSQSERQLGAFTFLYLMDNGKPLPLNKKIPEIRNRIVHQGRIAKESDAREFGSLVFDRIRQIERALEKYPDAANAEVRAETEIQKQSLPEGVEYGSLRIMSMMAKDGKVTGPVESFQNYLTALEQSISKGLA
jgi:hypothetical protein